MPIEIFDVDKFVELSKKAERCTVKRGKDIVKLKLRTATLLYTLKVEPTKTDEIFKKLNCDIDEI